MFIKYGLFVITLFMSFTVKAQDRDTLRYIGYSVYANPVWQIAMDEYERKWLRDKQAFVVGAELNYSALPSDSDAFARDYNYPTLQHRRQI